MPESPKLLSSQRSHHKVTAARQLSDDGHGSFPLRISEHHAHSCRAPLRLACANVLGCLQREEHMTSEERELEEIKIEKERVRRLKVGRTDAEKPPALSTTCRCHLLLTRGTCRHVARARSCFHR